MRTGEGSTNSTVGNERVKLLANTLNSAGLAFGIGGFVAPAISGQLAGWGAVIPIAWLGLAAGLHLCAQATLGAIRS